MFKLKLFIITLGLLVLTGCTKQEVGLSTLLPVQGGTGISSATTSDIGKALVVSSANPFQYTLGTVASSGGVGTTTLNATFVGFGNSDNTVTGTPTFTFNSSTNQLSITNVSSTSVTTTNLSVSGALALPANSITDAMVVAGLTISGGSIDNSPIGASTPSTGVFTSITSTNSAFATTSITGGFFQTDFTDCDADNQTVAYDLTTGKFGCGDDDSGGAAAVSLTNTLVAFGSADNTITSSTALSFNTSTDRLILTGTVSSTNVSSTLISALTAIGIGRPPTAGYSLDVNMGSNDVLFEGSGSAATGFFLKNTDSVTQDWYFFAGGNTPSLAPAKGFGIYDFTASQPRLSIDKTGNIGFRTISPQFDLQINSSSAPTILLNRNDGTITQGEILGGLAFDGADGNVPAILASSSVAIIGYAAEAWTTGDKGGYLSFFTSPIDRNNDVAASERMRITSEGLVGINTTTIATTLMVDGDAEITSDLVLGRGLSSAGWQTGLSIYAFGGERPAIAKNNTTGKIGYLASGGTQGLEIITAGRSVLINTRSEAGTTEFTTAGGITAYTNAALDIVGTWNNSTTRFWAIRSNFTDTGSNATTSLIDLMVGSVTKFNVQKDGWVSISTSTPIAALTLNASTTATGGIAFGTDVNLYRSAADILRTDDSLQIGGGLQFVTATGTSATTTNFFSTGLTFTTAVGTSVTTTNINWTTGTGNALVLTSGTSTDFFSTGLSFTNLSGTNATTTNFYASSIMRAPDNSIGKTFYETYGSQFPGVTTTYGEVMDLGVFLTTSTISKCIGYVRCQGACTTAGVEVRFRHGTNINATTTADALFTTTSTINSTTTPRTYCASGCDVTQTFNDVSINAGEALWAQIVSVSTTPTLDLTLSCQADNS